MRTIIRGRYDFAALAAHGLSMEDVEAAVFQDAEAGADANLSLEEANLYLQAVVLKRDGTRIVRVADVVVFA